MRNRYAYLAIGTVLAALATPAQAQRAMPCNQRKQIVTVLAQKFEEVEVGAGITPGGQLLEVFASPNGSWTLLLSLPTGQSCMMATGEDWDSKKRLAEAPGGGS